ncbi:TetR/AcrR family transcriptional regulator [Sphingomonas sp. UYP23]
MNQKSMIGNCVIRRREVSGIRDRIVSTATKMFAISGFHQTPMSELAVEANVSVGSIYRLFGNKNDLILAIVKLDAERKLREIRSIIPRLKDGDITIEDGLCHFIENVISKDEEAISFYIFAEVSQNAAVADEVRNQYQCIYSCARELASFVNMTLRGEKLNDEADILMGAAFVVKWPGLSCLESISETRFTNGVRSAMATLRAL